MSTNGGCTIFVSYSKKDRRALEDLLTSFRPYERCMSISCWRDTQIKAGAEWESSISGALASATVAVLLVSPAFLASDFIVKEELAPALRRAKEGGLKILWIPVRDSGFKKTKLADLQAAHPAEEPLMGLSKAKRDRAWVKICEKIEQAVQEARADVSKSAIGPTSGAIPAAGKPSRAKTGESAGRTGGSKEEPPSGSVEPLTPDGGQAVPPPERSVAGPKPAGSRWDWRYVYELLLLAFFIYLIWSDRLQIALYQLALLAVLSAVFVALMSRHMSGHVKVECKEPDAVGEGKTTATGGLAILLIVFARFLAGSGSRDSAGSTQSMLAKSRAVGGLTVLLILCVWLSDAVPPPPVCSTYMQQSFEGQVQSALECAAQGNLEGSVEILLTVDVEARESGCVIVAIRATRLLGDRYVEMQDLSGARQQYQLVWIRIVNTCGLPDLRWTPNLDGAELLYHSIEVPELRREFVHMLCGVARILAQDKSPDKVSELRNADRLLEDVGSYALSLSPIPVDLHARIEESRRVLQEAWARELHNMVSADLAEADNLRTTDDPLAALTAYEDAEKLADDDRCPCEAEEARALVGQGDCYRLAQQLDKAQSRYERAIEITADNSNGGEIWWAYASRGLAAIQALEPGTSVEGPSALERLISANAVFVRLGDQRGRALVVLGKALVYFFAGQLGDATDAANELRRDASLVGSLDAYDRACVAWLFGVLAEAEEDFVTAEFHLREAIKKIAGRRNVHLLVQLRNRLVRVLVERSEREPHLQEQKCSEARSVLSSAGQIASEEDAVAYTERKLVAGRVEECSGRLDAAISIWDAEFQRIREVLSTEKAWYERAKFKYVRYALMFRLARTRLMHAVRLASSIPCEEDCLQKADQQVTDATKLIDLLEAEIPQEEGLILKQLAPQLEVLTQEREQTRTWLSVRKGEIRDEDS